MPDKYVLLNIGVGARSSVFLSYIKDKEYGFGSLLRFRTDVGYIALSPKSLLIGSNMAMSDLKARNGNLYVVELERLHIVLRLSKAPTIVFANVLHDYLNPTNLIYECTNLPDLRNAMLGIVSTWR